MMHNLKQGGSFFLALFFLWHAQAKPTKFDINAQNDVASPGLKVRLSFDRVYDGPKDRFCVNTGGPFVKKDRNGDFLEETAYEFVYPPPSRQHATPIFYTTPLSSLSPMVASHVSAKKTVINAWGTISYTKRLVGSDLEQIFDEGSEVLERWRSQQPVKLYALDRSGHNNAYFLPDTTGGSIHFFPLVRKTSPGSVIIGYSSNDFDTASHETGHNVSHLLKPRHNLARPQTGAIDESFGDFMAISSALSLKPIRDDFLYETGRNLRRSSFLSEISESLSASIGLGVHGIRNALNDFTFENVTCEVHSLSRVLTGAFYDVLVSAFEEECPPAWFGGLFSCSAEQTDTRVLEKINKDLRQVVLKTHALVPYKNPSFADYGYTMYRVASNSPYFEYLESPILSAFEGREIDIFSGHNDFSVCDERARKQYGKGGFRNNHICGTLQNQLRTNRGQ